MRSGYPYHCWYPTTKTKSGELVKFGDDEKTVKALKRRFKVIHLPFKMDFDSGFEISLPQTTEGI